MHPFKTHRDHFAIDFSREALSERISEMWADWLSDAEYAERYGLRDNRDWQLSKARQALRSDPSWEEALIACLYRPFDWRYCYFSEVAMDYPRRELVEHVAGKDNLCLGIGRQGLAVNDPEWSLVMASSLSMDTNLYRRGGVDVFPLYLYPAPKANLFTGEPTPTPGGRHPNLSPAFIEDVSRRLKLTFIPDGRGDLTNTFGPEDVFNYTYAVLHSPTYRRRYAEFLKIDFPRVPLTDNAQLFRDLSRRGKELVALHLMEKTVSPITRYPMAGDNMAGDNKVDQVRYTEPGIDGTAGRVWINKIQYFEGVPPEVWGYHIGGYQIAQKWLKDRKGRQLTYDDLTHYQRITSALVETLRIQNEIDRVIGKWPIS
jgi:predicted helicase